MDYTVKRDGELCVVHGDVPILDSECLGACWALMLQDPVYDWQLADFMGAVMVVGSQDACNKKRVTLGLPLLPTATASNSTTQGEAAARQTETNN
jgi:hypothetical protein